MDDKITWYGHATLGLETAGYKILVDPFFDGNPASPVKAEAVTADFILITHGHDDHLGDTLAIAKRSDALVISNYEIAEWLDERGLRTHAQHLGGGHLHPFGYLKLTFALHGSALPDGSYGGNPAGFILTLKNGKNIYIAGDTGLFGDMRLIGDEDIELAVLPIGDNYTMGPADALRALKLLSPRRVLPIHYSTWELITQDAQAWSKQAAQTGVQVHLLKPGESVKI